MDKQPGQAPPPRPHWRRRHPSDAEVYVVHPTQFRTVVQQLTGAPAGTAQNHSQHDAGANAANTAAPAVAAQRRVGGAEGSISNNNGSGGRGRGTTLGQMHQECMAWAAQDDHDQH